MPGPEGLAATLGVDLPAYARSPAVRPMYAYAVAKGEQLEFIPCYCGCAALQHRNVRDCYYEGTPPDRVVWRSHAANCNVCLDIVSMVMELGEAGRPLPEIRRLVDRAYSSLDGFQSTPTPLPPEQPG